MPKAAVLSRIEQGSEGQPSWQPAVRQYPMSVWWHDFFNIVALGAINTANFWFLLYQTGFYRFWWASVVYFIVDFAWIMLDPSCVKSPYVLAAHHVVAAVYTLLPFFYPSTASKMSFVMTVEVRHLRSPRYLPASVTSMRSTTCRLRACSYVSSVADEVGPCR
jgi:hypothetical protein